MQKICIALLLIPALVISNFSSIALASGGQWQGMPVTQIHSPSSIALDMQNETNINVVMNDSQVVALSGTVMAQGTHGTSVVLNSAHVNALARAITNNVVATDTLQLRLIEEQLASNIWNITDPAAQVQSFPDENYPYLANRFRSNGMFWAVDSAGNFNFQYNAEPHTTHKFGYVLSSTVSLNINGSGYGVYERVFDTMDDGYGGTVSYPVQPIDRYMQRLAFTVKHRYKLANPVTSLVSGTSGSINISNQFVTAEGTSIPYEFDYEVWQGTPNTPNGVRLSSGRTVNGGKFNISVTPQSSNSISLYPTSRVTDIGASPQQIPLDLNNPDERFAYDIATFTRKAYSKISLMDNVAFTGIGAGPIVFNELHTEGDSSIYDLLGGGGYWTNPAVKMYGVSYAVYSQDGRPLMRTFTINQNNFNVVRSFVWGNYGDAPTIFDAAAVSDDTPNFGISTNDGSLLVNTGGYMYSDIAFVEYASAGTLSLRVRHTGAYVGATGMEAATTYQGVVTVNVETPGKVAVLSGRELKRINAGDKIPNEILLYTQENVDTLRMRSITYEGKPNQEHYLIKSANLGQAYDNAVGTNLTYGIDGNRIYVFMPWDMVKSGGADVRISLDFLKGDTEVFSQEIVIQNQLWKVQSSKNILTLNETNTFTAVVTDEKGVEQNRSSALLVDINSNFWAPLKRNDDPSGNIVGGLYNFSNVIPRAAGDVHLFVQESFSNYNPDVKAMRVLQALAISSDLSATLNDGNSIVTGLKQSLRFHVSNASGFAELGLVGAQVLGSGGAPETTSFLKCDNLTLVHSGNGNYAVDLVGVKPGTYYLRVYTASMAHFTDIEFTALPLVLEAPGIFAITP